MGPASGGVVGAGRAVGSVVGARCCPGGWLGAWDTGAAPAAPNPGGVEGLGACANTGNGCGMSAAAAWLSAVGWCLGCWGVVGAGRTVPPDELALGAELPRWLGATLTEPQEKALPSFIAMGGGFERGGGSSPRNGSISMYHADL